MRILDKISKHGAKKIEILNEKKCTLKKMIKINVVIRTEVYIRCKKKCKEISDKYQCYWSDTTEKYGWEIVEGEIFNINFLTYDIFADV